eukprot:4583427-Lingulodinium_polyedra.AAC.1
MGAASRCRSSCRRPPGRSCTTPSSCCCPATSGPRSRPAPGSWRARRSGSHSARAWWRPACGRRSTTATSSASTASLWSPGSWPWTRAGARPGRCSCSGSSSTWPRPT